MRRILIFGNSGSGKSTFAGKLKDQYQIPHLDLDSIAWKESSPPVRKDIKEVAKEIEDFISSNKEWVIEGCYADLIDIAALDAQEVYFLNIPVEQCIENCMRRPWESHKYQSKEDQDKNLTMLIDWVKSYKIRADDCSYKAHKKIYDSFSKDKKMILDILNLQIKS